MPSSSQKQHNFMAAIAHSPSFAKKAGVPMSVGQDFVTADKGRRFGSRPDAQSVNKPTTNQGASELFKKGGSAMATKMSNLFKGKETYGEELKEAKAIKSGKITPEQYAKGERSEGVHKMARGGMAKMKMPMKMANGGRVPGGKNLNDYPVKGSALKSGLDAGNKSADGVAQRGKTKGMNVVMKNRGGKC